MSRVRTRGKRTKDPVLKLFHRVNHVMSKQGERCVALKDDLTAMKIGITVEELRHVQSELHRNSDLIVLKSSPTVTRYLRRDPRTLNALLRRQNELSVWSTSNVQAGCMTSPEA